MKHSSLIAGLVAALTLSACAATDTPSRNSMADQTDFTLATSGGAASAEMVAAPAAQAQYIIDHVSIDVPKTLRVSEANTWHPNADIVWHGEPYGDRYAQVGAIFRDAFGTATAGMTQGRHVDVSIQVTYFHCLTEKTRYTFGGVHSMHFILTVRDAASGQIIDGPRKVMADVHGSGGAKAIAEEERGITQRVVVVSKLVEVMRRELTQPPVVAPNSNVVSRFQSADMLATPTYSE